ncbi:Retrovirus-related Pol polyprotein from transposon opus [Melia azedarach]|uniref:Retrovirus-related Pol polyprotein from transposon opus n=1 Tax=Melia azedarach TaxID=155640 RepID=A0ACC1XWL0_MELAZ|nr:Retrovirus-related Pol polyprotein from transposon opus [Melia azedarach]
MATRGVVSTYHLKLKFPVGNQVGVVKGDQLTARRCYASSVGRCNHVSTLDPRVSEVEQQGEPVEELEAVPICEDDPTKVVKVGTQLTSDVRTSLVEFLVEYSDRRAFNQERYDAIKEEVDKLLRAGFIRESEYPDWVFNVVLVRKPNGKWRMCVDFTDLNKACPKDSFPLPRIDQLVDATAGHELLSFMDAFSGLKNAGATYQHLVNKLFKEQIGMTMEIYVDDMITKSMKIADHVSHLRGTFDVLRKFGMKLNPEKCAFGVVAGKFLGYMVHQRGIEANPEKIKAIVEMRSPRMTKEIQSLAGRVAALSSVHDCSELSSNPRRGRTDAEACVLHQQGPDRGRKEILHKPESSGRLMKWCIELSEFEIHYQPRNAIKGQAIADFVAEFTPDLEDLGIDMNQREEWEAETSSPWILHVDGSSSSQGSGAGVLITSPDGVDISYALRFEFKASNNEAEYEALIAGLKMAKSLGAEWLEINSDSQLIVHQVNDEYQAKEDNMIAYLKKAKDLVGQFKQVKLQQIPREKNFQADMLSRLASLSETSLPGTVLVEVLPRSSIEEPAEVVHCVSSPSCWINPIKEYLEEGRLPEDQEAARKLKYRAARYCLIEGVLYRRSFTMPYLRCLHPDEADYVLREIHEGACGNHSGGRSLAYKALRQGYYWPTMQMGYRLDWTFPGWPGSGQVRHSGSRLLHQVGRGRAAGQDHGEKNHRLHLEIHHLSL